MRGFVSMLVVFGALGGCTTPLPRRPQQLSVIDAPPNITVTIEPAGATAWFVTAENQGDETIKLVWDESSFVDSKGFSYGRLIRGQTRLLDDTKPQMASVIVAHSRIGEFCIPESAPAYTPNLSHDGPIGALPEAVTKGVGRMLLTFDTGGGKQVWEGALVFDGSNAPPARTHKPLIKTTPSFQAAPPLDPSSI